MKSILIKESLVRNPLVTIAIPTYKRASLLKEAIDSAINQVCDIDYDILVVDNNPERDDETDLLLSSYSDSRISYYKNTTNLGMVGNWNRLYELARGEWVVMLHDDDLLYDDYLKLTFAFIKAIPLVDCIFPSFSFENKPNREYKRDIRYLRLTENMFLSKNIIGPPVGMCIKKILFYEVRGFSETFYPSLDYDFYFKIASKGVIYKLYDYPLSFYRISENESMKVSTLVSFIKKDSLLRRSILAKRENFCRWFFEEVELTHNSKFISMMTNLYGDYPYDKFLEETKKNESIMSRVCYGANIIYQIISFKLSSRKIKIYD